MPQTTHRGVAPLNPQPRWPEGYLTVLREAGAQEKTIPHCVAWVRRFFATYAHRHGHYSTAFDAAFCSALINAGIKYRQDFVKQIIRSLSDIFGLTRLIINRFDLLYHDKSLYIRVFGDRHVKWIPSISGS